MTVTINGSNDNPTAQNDLVVTDEDTSISFAVTGNDTDLDGADDLEVLSIDTTGIQGAVSINPDNDSLTYNPNGQFEYLAVGESVVETFTYTVSDGNGGTDVATATVTVNGVNDAPEASSSGGIVDPLPYTNCSEVEIFNFSGTPVLEFGTANEEGAIYRYTNSATGVDTLVEILSGNVSTFDNTSSGADSHFQPIISNGTVDFRIALSNRD